MTRGWKPSLVMLLGLLLAASLFASVNIGANAVQESLLSEVLAGLPADMIWFRSSSLYYPDIEVPDGATLFQWRSTIKSIAGVATADLFVTHHPTSISEPGDVFYTTAILQNASVYREISVVDGSPSLLENETYVATSSARFNDYPIGSNLTIQFLANSPHTTEQIALNVTLHVVGHVDITAKAEWLLSGFQIYDQDRRWVSFFIVDLKKTFIPVLDHYRSLDAYQPNLLIHVSVALSRAATLNPYNTEASLAEANQVQAQIQNRLPFPDSIVNDLFSAKLRTFQQVMAVQRLTFLLLALPVFFVTFYMGVSLGDVTLSMRRREVGLLVAKGGTYRQLTFLFLLEALTIGGVAGVLGILVAAVVLPTFVEIAPLALLGPLYLGVDTILLVVAFSILLAVLSIYVPARKALKVSLAEALRAYSPTSEAIQYHKKLAWACLILGMYKLLVWMFGFNTYFVISSYRSGSLLAFSLVALWGSVDTSLEIAAPILFTYGFVTVILKGFPWLLDRAAGLSTRLFGGMGAIPARDVARRPGRTAAAVLVIALLVGFSIQSLGYSASSKDWITRRVYTDIGADIRVKVQHPDNVTALLSTIRGFEGVQGAAVQYVLSMQYGMRTENELRAIDPDDWLHVAYYEEGWFPLGSAETTIRSLATEENGLVLERLIAVQFGLTQGDVVDLGIYPNRTEQQFRITGFFGPEPIDISQPGFTSSSAETTWSYVSANIVDGLGSASGYDSYILVRLSNAAADADVMDRLTSLEGVVEVSSAIEVLAGLRTNLLLYSQLSVVQLATSSAFILATAGSLLIHYLGLYERRRNTTLMSRRGASYYQLVTILASEVLIVTTFALAIGFFVGFISLYGTVQGADYSWPLPMPVLVAHRFLPIPFVPVIFAQIGVLVGVLLGAPLFLIVVEAKRAQTDLAALR